VTVLMPVVDPSHTLARASTPYDPALPVSYPCSWCTCLPATAQGEGRGCLLCGVVWWWCACGEGPALPTGVDSCVGECECMDGTHPNMQESHRNSGDSPLVILARSRRVPVLSAGRKQPPDPSFSPEFGGILRVRVAAARVTASAVATLRSA